MTSWMQQYQKCVNFQLVRYLYLIKMLVGLVTEDGIMRHLDSDGADIKNTVVSSIIEPAPAVVDYNTPTNALVALIRITKCILVSKNSNIIGIITASDTLQLAE